jgi:predicted metal-dependent hydrolase
MGDPEALDFLKSKSNWIQQHLHRMEKQRWIQPSDFSQILFLGEPRPTRIQYRKGKPSMEWDQGEGCIHIGLPENDPGEILPKLLDAFYRNELRQRIPPLIEEWEPLLKVEVNAVRYKKMKTRWGTCNTWDHRIWINVELAKKSFPCIEYIVVHEMCHLLERGHGPAFKAKMDVFLPHWRTLRLELNGRQEKA